jgi:hypothetical protein
MQGTESKDRKEKRILKEEADFRLLTSFIYGMRAEAGRELRIRKPETLDQALSMATVVYNAKKMELRHRDYDTVAVKKGEKDFTNQRGYERERERERESRGRHGVRAASRKGRQYDDHKDEGIGAEIGFDPQSRASHAEGTAT